MVSRFRKSFFPFPLLSSPSQNPSFRPKPPPASSGAAQRRNPLLYPHPHPPPAVACSFLCPPAAKRRDLLLPLLLSFLQLSLQLFVLAVVVRPCCGPCPCCCLSLPLPLSLLLFVLAAAVAVALAVILSEAKDPEALHPPIPPAPFNPC